MSFMKLTSKLCLLHKVPNPETSGYLVYLSFHFEPMTVFDQFYLYTKITLLSKPTLNWTLASDKLEIEHQIY